MKKTGKHNRQFKVLLGLVNYFLKSGKPVGSNTLKEAGFDDLSSATIRNYFANLEKEGFLAQQHASGGRIPTNLAYRAYAKEFADSTDLPPSKERWLKGIRQTETREIAGFLQNAVESLSQEIQLAAFLSAPRFDHDYIVDLRVVPIDHQRTVCIIVTDFGVIRTEIIHTEKKMSSFAAKRIETYFHWRLTGHDQPSPFESKEEEELAQKIYNEVILRHLVGYSNFIELELFRTGFSTLLSHPEFNDASALGTTLSLFENAAGLKMLVKECSKAKNLKFWIGDDLLNYSPTIPNCTVIAHPYCINQNVVGVIGLLGPTRLPYKEIFGVIRAFADSVSQALTRNLYKFKITFRQPNAEFLIPYKTNLYLT